MDFSCYFKNPKISIVLLVAPFLIRTDCSFFDVYIKYVIFREEVAVNVSQLSELVESYLQFCYVKHRNFVSIFSRSHERPERRYLFFTIKIFVVSTYILSMWGNTKKQRRQI